MTPTLKDQGLYAATKIQAEEVSRFDIIAFLFRDKLVVKRVIGLPQEFLVSQNGSIMIENNKETINISHQTSKIKSIPTTVLANSFFLLSDNLSTLGNDSRKLGPIDTKFVKYKFKFGIWPTLLRFQNPYA